MLDKGLSVALLSEKFVLIKPDVKEGGSPRDRLAMGAGAVRVFLAPIEQGQWLGDGSRYEQ